MSDQELHDILYGADEIRAFVNSLMTDHQFTTRQIYRLIEKKRIPAGRHNARRLIASKRTIRTDFLKAAGAPVT